MQKWNYIFFCFASILFFIFYRPLQNEFDFAITRININYWFRRWIKRAPLAPVFRQFSTYISSLGGYDGRAAITLPPSIEEPSNFPRVSRSASSQFFSLSSETWLLGEQTGRNKKVATLLDRILRHFSFCRPDPFEKRERPLIIPTHFPSCSPSVTV